MSDIPPDVLAQADQEIANANAHLDKGVADYRKEVAYRGEPRALAFVRQSLIDSMDGDPGAVSKLAFVVAIALRRLAGEQP